MAPVLSPKKSVEGAVGGVLGAALLGVAYAAATKGPVMEYAVICAVGALISMVGDLAASAIKRNQNLIKGAYDEKDCNFRFDRLHWNTDA